MLTEQQIQEALKASRVVPVGVAAPHGPLGLDHLAETVARLAQAKASGSGPSLVERPIALSLETWEKLDQLAREAPHSSLQPTSASAVAAALLEQCVGGK